VTGLFPLLRATELRRGCDDETKRHSMLLVVGISMISIICSTIRAAFPIAGKMESA